jgi:hypothetical protein
MLLFDGTTIAVLEGRRRCRAELLKKVAISQIQQQAF